jgi:pyruvate dehydrogenase E2 component (dihydrolipoamide acetyltransferase)
MSSTREVRLPALSATMEEATLLAWKVSPGDTVQEGEPIAEVSTDKVDMDLEAPFPGVIRELLVTPGTAVPLGAALATIETESEDLLGGLDLGGGAPEAQPVEPAVSSPESRVSSLESRVSSPGSGSPGPTAAGIVAASPPARKMARELGIDLALVAATGARGQVTPSDVSRHAASVPAVPDAPPAGAPAAATPTVATPKAAPADDTKRLSVRRATTEIMGRSAAIPQFTLWRTLVLDRAAARRGGVSWTTILARGLAAALERHPELNARWDEAGQTVAPFEEIRVGLAVDRPGVGLVVVTVALPDDPQDSDRAVRSAADRAKTGKLRPEDLAQASITLSNLGGLGVDRFNALLFPPQPAIVSAGSIRMRPIATGDGALKAALTCEIGLTVDHRVADGADGARFLDDFAAIVEAG